MKYYPFLRAKQYELKALREFSGEYLGQSDIIPIIEPVKRDSSKLWMAVNDFLSNGMTFALVLNPSNGDFRHDTFPVDLLNDVLNNNKEKWIPSFIYSKANASDIISEITKSELKNVMIIFLSCMDPEDTEALSLINREDVTYIVNDFGASSSREVKSLLRESKKEIVQLTDCFKTKQRNAEYALTPDEFFTDQPFYNDDKFSGYSDYTTLPSEYIDGGMLPYAIAIHLTYKKNKNNIYVHHFVSDNNQSPEDIRGKFREAAKKIAPFYVGRELTKAVSELIDKAEKDYGYPGLGYLKKLSIKNHLELIKSL